MIGLRVAHVGVLLRIYSHLEVLERKLNLQTRGMLRGERHVNPGPNQRDLFQSRNPTRYWCAPTHSDGEPAREEGEPAR